MVYQPVIHPSHRQFQTPLPYSTVVLVLGIISIALCCVYGIIGLVNGIVALVLAGKATALYKAEPELYSDASYSNLKAGRICAIVGTVLSSLIMLFFLAYIAFIGTYLGLFTALIASFSQAGY